MMDFRKLIPCKCKDRTFRVDNMGTTLVYYPPIYNDKGVNVNPDRNRTDYNVTCRVCMQVYAVESVLGNFTLKGVWRDGDTTKMYERA